MPRNESRRLDAKKAARLRKRQLEEEKRRARKRERVRTWAYGGVGVVVGGAIIAAVLVPELTKPTPVANRALTAFGVRAAQAGCTTVESPTTPPDREIGPGSAHAGTTTGHYTQAPPVGGDHYATPLSTANQHYYGPTTKPKLEQLVANELANDTVVWYLPSAGPKEQKTLQQLATNLAANGRGYVIMAPWWPTYAKFPAGKQIALATKGHVQYCAKVSGEAVGAFLDRFPNLAATNPSTAPSAAPSVTAPAQVPSVPATGSPAPTHS